MDTAETRRKYRDIIDKERPVHVDDHFSSAHPKMDPYERAKIFAPFSALRGLNKALSSRITVPVPDSDISPEREEEINRCLQSLSPGEMVSVMIRTPNVSSESTGNGPAIMCEKITGTVAKVKLEEGYIRIINERIPLEHIYNIEIL